MQKLILLHSICRAADHLRDAADNLGTMHLDFQAVKEEATRARMTWGVTPIFAEKRIAKRKRHFDELAEGSRLSNREKCFQSQCILEDARHCL